MRYATPAAFRAALDQRLKVEALRTGLTTTRLRKRVAFELFLRRLVAVAHGRWVLKGAFALDLRLDVATRPTKDIDLGREDSVDDAIEDITAAQQLHLDDFFSFTATRTDAFEQTDEFAAVRFHVRAELAGRTFEQFVVDVGLTDPMPWTPDAITTSDFLAFADIEQVAIPAVPLAQHLAEKVHAYTRRYGDTQAASTRPKDLVDILLIASAEPIDARALRECLERTFEQRARQPLPDALANPPADWARPFGQLARDLGLEPSLDQAFAEAAAFLDPVLSGPASGRWNPAARQWVDDRPPED
jgi:predicted nucleotidyltransferase component of viral defense system